MEITKAKVTGLLFCCALLLGACSGEEAPAEATTTSSPATTSTPEEPTSEPTSQPTPASEMPGATGHSELEQRVIDAMATAGVTDPGVAEDGFSTATVSGGWDTRTAWVYAYDSAQGGTPGEVLEEVTIGDVPAKVVRTETLGDVLAFQCGELGYQITALNADGQAGSGTVDGATPLAEALIPELGCER
jgi:hypothetical protein